MEMSPFSNISEFLFFVSFENCENLSLETNKASRCQKHLEEVLGRCNTSYHRLRLVVNKKMGDGGGGGSPDHIITNLQTRGLSQAMITLSNAE